MVEVLETRLAPAVVYTVTLVTDNFSGAGGQADPADLTGTKGDLRWCINKALVGAGNSVQFAVPGTSFPYIPLQAQLPPISTPITVDATTQPGYSGAPVVTISGNDPRLGTSAGIGATGLTITAGSTTVKGLIIENFSVDGIDLTTNGGDTISNCYIGIDRNQVAAPNNGDGILVACRNNTIGGTTPGSGSLISGNGGHGIDITANGQMNLVLSNIIGTDVSGTEAIANGGNGILVKGGINRIGITSSGSPAGNLISGNSLDGIHIENGSSNFVGGNFIGTDQHGGNPIPNQGNGIAIVNSSANQIGAGAFST